MTMGSGLRRRDLLFGLLGALALIGGVVVTDVVINDGERIAPEDTELILLPGGVAQSDEPDPGGILIRYSPNAAPGDASVPPPAGSSQGGDGPSGGGSSSGASDGGSSSSANSPAGAPGQPQNSGSGSFSGDATIVGFIDLCAESPIQPDYCSGGIGATVLGILSAGTYLDFDGPTFSEIKLGTSVITETPPDGKKCAQSLPSETWITAKVTDPSGVWEEVWVLVAFPTLGEKSEPDPLNQVEGTVDYYATDATNSIQGPWVNTLDGGKTAPVFITLFAQDRSWQQNRAAHTVASLTLVDCAVVP